MAARTWALLSLSVKYQCPDAAATKLDISADSQIRPISPSSTVLAKRFSLVTVKICRDVDGEFVNIKKITGFNTFRVYLKTKKHYNCAAINPQLNRCCCMLRIIQEALTFDDVLLVPGHSTVPPHTANLQTRLTRGVTLNIPMVSAAMDTVSEAVAIALAQEGGIGFIHKNMKPEEQAKHVREVKKYESGVVSDPVTVEENATIGEVIALSKRLGYSGFPVTDKDNNLIGIVTGRDLRFEKRLNLPIRNVMTGKDDLVTVKEGASSDVV